MRQVHSCFTNKTLIQLGDFNTVRVAPERLVGFDSTAALEFNECLSDIEHDDLPSKGFWFTWSNKRGGLEIIKVELIDPFPIFLR